MWTSPKQTPLGSNSCQMKPLRKIKNQVIESYCGNYMIHPDRQVMTAVTIRPRKKNNNNNNNNTHCLLATMSMIFWLLRFVWVWNTPTRLPLSETTVHCRFRDPKICQVSENSSQGYSSRRPSFSPSCRCGILCPIRNLSSFSGTNNPCSQPSSHRHIGTSLGQAGPFFIHSWMTC